MPQINKAYGVPCTVRTRGLTRMTRENTSGKLEVPAHEGASQSPPPRTQSEFVMLLWEICTNFSLDARQKFLGPFR